MLLLFDTDVAGALGEQPVSAGLDSLNLEVPILIANSSVVSTLLLVFCNQLDGTFLIGSLLGSLTTVPFSVHLLSFNEAGFCAHKAIAQSTEKTDTCRSLMGRLPERWQ